MLLIRECECGIGIEAGEHCIAMRDRDGERGDWRRKAEGPGDQ